MCNPGAGAREGERRGSGSEEGEELTVGPYTWSRPELPMGRRSCPHLLALNVQVMKKMFKRSNFSGFNP